MSIEAATFTVQADQLIVETPAAVGYQVNDALRTHQPPPFARS